MMSAAPTGALSALPACVVSSSVQFNPVHKVRGEPRRIAALFELDADESDAPRAPIELAIVLDVSGSMAGEKMHNSKVAVRQVVSCLIPGDVIHLIVYNHEPTSLVLNGSVEQRDHLLQQVDGLSASGGTDIISAINHVSSSVFQHPPQRMNAGIAGGDVVGGSVDDEVADAMHPPLLANVRRVFLYSDGQGQGSIELHATAAARVATAHDVIINTFGIGNDINVDIMTAIADSANGHYDFVTPRRIEELTTHALRATARVFGQRAVLELQFPRGVATIDSVVGHDEERSDNSTCITIGDLRSGNKHQVLVHVTLCPELASPNEASSAETTAAEQQTLLCTYSLGYRPADCPLVYKTVRGETCVTLTAAPPDGPLAPNVGVALALAATARANTDAQALIEAGNIAQALDLLRASLAALSEFAAVDTTGFVETQVRRGTRSLRRLEEGGGSVARRVNLELVNQSRMLDNMSGADFERSASGNHTPVMHFHRHPIGGSDSDSPHRGPRVLLGDDDDEDDDDTIDDDPAVWLAQRPPSPPLLTTHNAVRPGFGDSPKLNPINLPEGITEDPSVPPEFICPITRSVMTDPVSTADGQTYERRAIEKWFVEGHQTSPSTGMALASRTLVPNIPLRSLILSWHRPAEGTAPQQQTASDSPP